MEDNLDKLKHLKKLIIEFRDDRDWSQFHSLKNLSTALSIEAAELSELTLWKSDEEVMDAIKDEEFSKDLQNECADILNYLILISDLGGFDIIEAAIDKVAQNSIKYPVEKSRGKATKYSKL